MFIRILDLAVLTQFLILIGFGSVLAKCCARIRIHSTDNCCTWNCGKAYDLSCSSSWQPCWPNLTASSSQCTEYSRAAIFQTIHTVRKKTSKTFTVKNTDNVFFTSVNFSIKNYLSGDIINPWVHIYQKLSCFLTVHSLSISLLLQHNFFYFCLSLTLNQLHFVAFKILHICPAAWYSVPPLVLQS